MKIESWPRIFSWPTYSWSARGRRLLSTTSSCGLAGDAAIRRSVSITEPPFDASWRARMPRACARRAGSASCLGEELQCLADAVGNGDAFRQVLGCAKRFLVAVTERDERVLHIRRHG